MKGFKEDYECIMAARAFQKKMTLECATGNEDLYNRCFSDVEEPEEKKDDAGGMGTPSTADKSLEDKELKPKSGSVEFVPQTLEAAAMSIEAAPSEHESVFVGPAVDLVHSTHGISKDDALYNLQTVLYSLILNLPELTDPPQNVSDMEANSKIAQLDKHELNTAMRFKQTLKMETWA